MFQPLAAPRDNELENLYQKLGAKWLTSCIVTKYSSEGATKQTKWSQKYQNLINERQKLLVFDPDTRLIKNDLKSNFQQVLQVRNFVS